MTKNDTMVLLLVNARDIEVTSVWKNQFGKCAYYPPLMYIAEMNGTGTCQYQDKHLKADEAAYLNGCSVCFVPECMLNEERLIEYHTQGERIA